MGSIIVQKLYAFFNQGITYIPHFFCQKVFSKLYLETCCKIQCSLFLFPFNYKKIYRETDKQTRKWQEIANSYDRVMKALHFQKAAQRGNVCTIYEDLSRTCIWSLTCYLPQCTKQYRLHLISQRFDRKLTSNKNQCKCLGSMKTNVT